MRLSNYRLLLTAAFFWVTCGGFAVAGCDDRPADLSSEEATGPGSTAETDTVSPDPADPAELAREQLLEGRAEAERIVGQAVEPSTTAAEHEAGRLARGDANQQVELAVVTSDTAQRRESNVRVAVESGIVRAELLLADHDSAIEDAFADVLVGGAVDFDGSIIGTGGLEVEGLEIEGLDDEGGPGRFGVRTGGGSTVDLADPSGGSGGLGMLDTGGGRGTHASLGLRTSTPRNVDLTLSTSVSSGELDGDVVDRTIRSRDGAMVNCFERELRRDETPDGGHATFDLTVEGGAVREVVTSNDSLRSNARRCIERVFRRLRPGEGNGEVQVNVTFDVE